MVTVVNNPGPNNPSPDSSAGWAVAVIILLIVIVGGLFWYFRYHRAAAPAPGTTIQVNVPTGGSSGGSGTTQ